MKCTNKNLKWKISAILMVIILSVTGCGNTRYDMAYELNSDVSSYQLVNISNQETVEPFAADLCVASKDIPTAGIDLSDVGAAALFDTKNLDTLYALNVNEQIHPASLTKVMTALVALKYGSTDQMLTASQNVTITEPGAQLCGLKPGDQMTLDQALHILLLYSANDVAILIAEGVSGSVEEFVALMNEEAKSLGATNCNFTNPNGLTEDGHYVTAYDLYLIFQEALQYDLFNQIIQMTSYSTVYKDSSGNEKSIEMENTNLYLKGVYDMPANVTVIGGKTGTTNAAGHCLILLSRSSNGTPYISIIMKDTSREELYTDMTDLLETIK
ncbi:MAG: D-alanyl-D-alanine carboxypeptidase [Lachnospiraceae bacterium]|nr:D-alanyl-D-alanine carboxypeptidase [Lachnospiraceae bacterium]